MAEDEGRWNETQKAALDVLAKAEDLCRDAGISFVRTALLYEKEGLSTCTRFSHNDSDLASYEHVMGDAIREQLVSHYKARGHDIKYVASGDPPFGDLVNGEVGAQLTSDFLRRILFDVADWHDDVHSSVLVFPSDL